MKNIIFEASLRRPVFTGWDEKGEPRGSLSILPMSKIIIYYFILGIILFSIMIFKSVKEILKEFERAYERKQYGWHIFYGYDRYGRLNIYIVNESGSGWTLMMDPHFGVGAKIRRINIDDLIELDKVGFGLRKLDKKLFDRIIYEMKKYGNLRKETIDLIKSKPIVKRSEIKRLDKLLVGPYVYYPAIESIDERINRELRKRFLEEFKLRYKYIA